jgi:hypothetical protein
LRRSGRLSRVLLCVCLEFGALAGIPMRPEQIEDLLRMLGGPEVVEALPEEDDQGGGGPPRRAVGQPGSGAA